MNDAFTCDVCLAASNNTGNTACRGNLQKRKRACYMARASDFDFDADWSIFTCYSVIRPYSLHNNLSFVPSLLFIS